MFFDVDGTLVPGISSAVYLAGHLGHQQAVAEAEAAWDVGTVSPRYVEELDARGWAGTSVEQIREWLADLPLVDGIEDVVSWCVANEVVPVLATLAWRPVGEYLCARFGFVEAYGPTLEVREGRYTGISLIGSDEYGKRDFAREFAKGHGLSLAQCAAVGDSLSDLPLFGEAGLAIGFNATDPARALAHTNHTGNDLRAVLPTLREWFEC
ncbi:HAD family hydrolase [Kribbella sp. NPDC004536]|uniref:HAD family hydrolase n=1 Tax=Kribbella sp. NPDC004536 TaxID=3364106 RepID=UPI0036B2691D